MFNITKKEKTFWDIIDLLDWKHEGDDEKVIQPVIKYLSKQGDDFIFAFEEQMAEHLHAIDGKKWAEAFQEGAGGIYSDDGFLYCRCIAIVNGEQYYNAILTGEEELDGDLEFESILYTPRLAWAKKHKCAVDDYPYLTKVSYESKSNEKLWV